MVIDELGWIVFVWNTYEWKLHDYNIFWRDQTWVVLNWWYEKFLDSAYIWVLAYNTPENPIYVCKKNWKIKKLTDDEIEMNTLISSYRVGIEQKIWHIKKLDILNWKFRHKVVWNFRTVEINMKHKTFLIGCGLQNLSKIC